MDFIFSHEMLLILRFYMCSVNDERGMKPKWLAERKNNSNNKMKRCDGKTERMWTRWAFDVKHTGAVLFCRPLN